MEIPSEWKTGKTEALASSVGDTGSGVWGMGSGVPAEFRNRNVSLCGKVMVWVWCRRHTRNPRCFPSQM